MLAAQDFRQTLARVLRLAPRHPLMAANHDAFMTVDHDRPLEDCRFVVLDTELTGLDVRRDEIVSIGAVRIEGMAIAAGESFYRLIQPKAGLPKASTLIHRITPEQVKDRPRLRAVLPALIEFVDGCLIVGHHVGLDMGFLNRACRTVYGAPLANPCLDTMRMAQIYRAQQWESSYDRYQGNVSFALPDLAAEFGLPRFPQHNALADALQTAYLFLYLARKLSGGGVRTLRELFEAGRSWRWYL
jgi:DNA polymerase-3 subunit epsilon